MADEIVLDGSHGEGGGQILRTALTAAVLLGRPVRVENIRAGRRKPGLAAQHLTAVRAAAEITDARVEGDVLGSGTLRFAPRTRPRAGEYQFDVGAARPGGSAGATTLVLQTILLPLALADGGSTVSIRGGTHMAWSPSFDYVDAVWLPALRRLGITASVTLGVFGWFPIGKGEIRARVEGRGTSLDEGLTPLAAERPGKLLRVAGRAIGAELPSHIPQRMVSRTRSLLRELDAPFQVEPERVRAASPGAGIFLSAEHEDAIAGFGALGERGKPSEAVAEEAARALLEFEASGTALDRHLADQILLPLAFATGPSSFTVEIVTRHLRTNAWVIEQFGLARIEIDARSSPPHVRVTPTR